MPFEPLQLKLMARSGRYQTAALLLAAFSVLAPPVARAAGVVGTGTPASCDESALNTRLAGGGLVTFDCGALPHAIVLTSQKSIVANTEIDGGGLITLSGNDVTRILNAAAGITLKLRGITLRQGYVTAPSPAQGGAILCQGCNLEISDSTFSDNHTNAPSSEGGAIWFGPPIGGASGTLTVLRSTFKDNSATSFTSLGGAIFLHTQDQTAWIVASTFSGNLAGGSLSGNGGAVAARGAQPAYFVNCTFSRNEIGSGGSGGAIFNSQFPSNPVVLRNTIIANSIGAGNCDSVSAPIVNGGNNLEFGGTLANSCGVTASLADPLGGNLLGANGGLTETIALPAGSPAIEGGNAAFCATLPPQGPGGRDERNWAHVNTCDVGAFEFGAQADPVSVLEVPALAPTGTLILVTVLGVAAVLLVRRRRARLV